MELNTSNIYLEHIGNFIKVHNLQEITNANLPSLKYKTYDPDSIWSERIFGNLNSNRRKSTFGWVKLPVTCITPSAFNLVVSCCDEFYEMDKSRTKYFYEIDKKTKKGTLTEALPEDVNYSDGKTGLSCIIEILKTVDFDHVTPRYGSSEKLNWVRSHISDLLIDQWLVLPAGLRDINIYTNSNRIVIESDINTYYSELINNRDYTPGSDAEMDEVYYKTVQGTLNKIVTWTKNSNLKGKSGLFRSSILKKRIDFSARIILLSDPKIGMDEVIVPFHILFILYLPLCYHHIVYQRNVEAMEAIQEFMKVEYIDDTIFNMFSDFVKDNHSKLPPSLLNILIKVMEGFMPEQRVICKRDPVLGRWSYFSAVPIIGKGHVAYIPQTLLEPLSADSDGDQLMVAPIFSESAKKNAKETLSYASKSSWVDPMNIGKPITTLTPLSLRFCACA